MADKYMTLSTGRKTLVEATVSSAGVGNAGDIVALDTDGKLNSSVMPVGIGADTLSVIATEALTAGNFVNIFESTGAKCRKADATTSGKEAVGFVLDNVAQNDPALVYFEGSNTQLTGLTVGTRYYLATSAGGSTATPPSSSANVVQYLGVATSVSSLTFEPDDGVIV